MAAAYCRPRVISALVALCWLALPSPAAAQSMLGGVVRDPTGQVASNVIVVAENEDTGDTWEARSDPIGLYAFYRLPNGTYTIRVSLPPLTFIKTGIKIRPGQKTALDVPLRIGREESVTVRTRAEQKTFQRDGSIGANFARKTIETMPLSNGRTLQSMLPPIPGIVVTDSVGTLAQYTSIGQQRFQNGLAIDGMSANLGLDVTAPGIGQAESGALPALAATGGTQTLIPLAAIEEIKISTTNAPPESARAPGAQTAIVTRAGGDRLTGAAFANVRPDRLGASDWFVNAGRTPERQTRYRDLGASLGGPLLPQRVYYFAAAERQRIDRPVRTTIPVPSHSTRENAPADIRRVLDAYPLPNGRELGQGLAELASLFPVTSKLSSLSARLDSSLSASHRLFTRVNVGASDGDEISPELRLPRLSFDHRERTLTRTGTVGLTSALSSWAANELKANVSEHRGSVVASPAAYGDAGPLPLDLLLPGSAPDAWAAVSLFPDSAGTLMSGRTAASRQQQIQIIDTLTVATGRHEWRIGFDFARVTTSSAAPDRYSYRFLSLSDLWVRVLVERFTGVRAERQSWSLFAQDAFRVSRRLSLNYGLRYDVQPAPASLTDVQPSLMEFSALPELRPRQGAHPWWKTSHEIGPQLAASYLLGTTSGRETSLHAGWGLTYAPLTSPGHMPFRGSPYATSRTLSISTFPVAASALEAPTIRGDYYSIPEDLRRPRTHDWYVGVDQGLPGAQRLSLVYVGAAGRDLVYWHSYDIQATTVHAFSNAATSDYDALLVQYVRRMSRRWHAQVAYTWSHAIDTDSGESLSPHPPPSVISPEANRGSSDFDRRHVLNVMATYRLPAARLPKPLRLLCSDWHVDMVGMFRSGAPVNVVGSTQLSSGSYRLRPDIVPGAPLWTGRRINLDAFQVPSAPRQGTLGRNALRASPLRQIDLALSRSIRLGARVTGQFRLDAFNVFNVANFGAPEGRLTFPNFGEPYQSYADSMGTGTLSRGGLTPIQQIGGPRSIQLGLRLGM